MLIILACLTTPMTDTRQITKEFAERHKWTREKDAQYIRAIVDIMMTQHHGEWTSMFPECLVQHRQIFH